MMIRPRSLGDCLVESGFVNQIWVLTGLVLQAAASHDTLCLPPFSAMVHDKQPVIPLRDLLDPDALATALAPAVNVSECRDSDARRTRHNGWRAYKFGFAAARSRQGGTHVQQPLVDTLNDHIRPSARVRALVERNVAAIGAPFDCVHARVERDIAHVAKVPALADFERAESALRRDGDVSVFVASGANLTGLLKRGWRQSALFAKAGMDAREASTPYMMQAAVDFFTCARAERFVGYGASSFSRAIAERFARHGKPVALACAGARPLMLTNATRLRTHWTMCPTTQKLRLGSFGWGIGR